MATAYEMEANQAFQVFYDGECPLCMREIHFLKRRDERARISFVDIAHGDFDPSALNRTREELMAQIHGRLPSGEFVIGVDVFRHLYTAVGLGWLVTLTRVPGFAWCLDRAYALFARNRLRLTGRSDAATASCRTSGSTS